MLLTPNPIRGRKAAAEARTRTNELLARTVTWIGDIDDVVDPHATVDGPGPFDCECKACSR